MGGGVERWRSDDEFERGRVSEDDEDRGSRVEWKRMGKGERASGKQKAESGGMGEVSRSGIQRKHEMILL